LIYLSPLGLICNSHSLF